MRSAGQQATTLKPDTVLLSKKRGSYSGQRSRSSKEVTRGPPRGRTIMLLDSDECDVVVVAFRSGTRRQPSRHGTGCRRFSYETGLSRKRVTFGGICFMTP